MQRRSVEQQQKSLLQAHSVDKKDETPLVTRGSSHLLHEGVRSRTMVRAVDNLQDRRNHAISLVVAGVAAMVSLMFLDFIQSLMLALALGVPCYVVLHLLKVKQAPDEVGMKQFVEPNDASVEQLCQKYRPYLSQECLEVLKEIDVQLKYLLPVVNANIFSSQEQHYVNSCLTRYLPDLLEALAKAPLQHLEEPQKLCVTQFKKMQGDLADIMQQYVEDINRTIKTNGYFSQRKG